MRRAYLPVTIAGRPTELLIDTGSPHSFVFSETASAADATSKSISLVSVSIGCREFPFPKFPVDASRRLAEPSIAGVLGVDAMLGVITELDFAAGKIQFDGDQTPRFSPTDVLPMEAVGGVALVQLEVDGRLRTLLLDTGTADLLLLEKPHGTPHARTIDVLGNSIDYEVGTADVTWPSGHKRTVPCWRTLHHPAFERHIQEIGRRVDGLLGLSAFEGRKLTILAARHVVWLGP